MCNSTIELGNDNSVGSITKNTGKYAMIHMEFTNNNCVKFIHFEIPLQQKIDQIIHLNSKKKPIGDSYCFSFLFAYSQTICVATQ